MTNEPTIIDSLTTEYSNVCCRYGTYAIEYYEQETRPAATGAGLLLLTHGWGVGVKSNSVLIKMLDGRKIYLCKNYTNSNEGVGGSRQIPFVSFSDAVFRYCELSSSESANYYKTVGICYALKINR